MSAELIQALDQLEKEKGIEKEVLIEAIEAALISAYKRNFGSTQNVKISFDRESGDVKVFALRRVTSRPENDEGDISLEEARKLNSEYQEEDIAEIEGELRLRRPSRWLCRESGRPNAVSYSTSFIIRKVTSSPASFKETKGKM